MASDQKRAFQDYSGRESACAAQFCDEPHISLPCGSLYNVIGQSNSLWSAVPILGASLPPMPGEGMLE
jgi:hypothetical protein